MGEKMRNFVKAASGALVVAILAVSPASSAPITLNFSGTVQFTNFFPFFCLASAGDTIAGSIV
jgi:hypothetical protein